jgi:hypothetical protein
MRELSLVFLGMRSGFTLYSIGHDMSEAVFIEGMVIYMLGYFENFEVLFSMLGDSSHELYFKLYCISK